MAWNRTTQSSYRPGSLEDTCMKIVSNQKPNIKPTPVKEEKVVKPAEDFDRIKPLFECTQCNSKDVIIESAQRDQAWKYYIVCKDCRHDAWVDKDIVIKKRDEYEASLEKLWK